MLETVEVAQDADLSRRRAISVSFRNRARGLQSDLRTAQSPLEEKGRDGRYIRLRNCESCELAGVTRTVLGTCVSGRASENAGAELLEGSHQRS
jgi:hypothetical protein